MKSDMTDKPLEASLEERIRQLEQELANLRAERDHLVSIEQEHARHTAFMLRLVEMLPVGISMHTDGIVTFINSAGLEILRAKRPEDVVGKIALEFVPPERREQTLARINELYHKDTGETVATVPFVEEQFICLDGTLVDVEVSAVTLPDQDQSSTVLVMFRDISEQKRDREHQARWIARFRQLISLLPEATFLQNNKGEIFFVNQMALQLLGVASPDEIVGRSFFDLLHPVENKREDWLLETSEPVYFEPEPFIRLDGQTVVLEIMAFPFDEEGERAVLVAFRDVTERERMLKALEKSEARFRLLAELLPASVFIVNEDGAVIYLNAASERILGFSKEDSFGYGYRSRMQAHPKLFGEPLIIRNLALGETAHFELKVKDKQGQWRWLDVTMVKTVMEDQHVGLGVATDTTWRKNTEDVLKRQAQKLANAYEEERRRIARELHDEVGQQLIGMKFILERAQYFTTSESGRNALLAAREILANLTETVREMSLSFRPAMLDDLGLLQTLVWYFDRYTGRTGIRVRFEHADLDDRRLTQTAAITIYRIVQEALSNVARHTQVDVVDVRIRVVRDCVLLYVRDEGGGFDLDRAMKSHASSGVTGMMERVRLIGGQIHIETEPGEGTTIAVTIPLSGD